MKNIPDTSSRAADINNERSVLFLDKVFLRPRKRTLRGVELFNLSLIRDLVREGFQLTVPVHDSWKGDLSREVAGAPLELCKTGWRWSLLNGLQAAWRLRRESHARIILANVAHSLIPAWWLMRLWHGRRPAILFAHRMPTRRFLAALAREQIKIIAVNNIIAARFKEAGFDKVNMLFGHINADRFFPVESSRRRAPKMNFCVVGFLDNAWKGADTALAAFRALPKDISARCVLHLASYSSPPSFPEENIKVYKWLPIDAMPAWLRQMDVMIVPSRDEGVMRETFSLTMIEGMLTGLPVLASNLPILAEKLDAGGGRIFSNIAELSRCMASLVSRPELCAELGKQARRVALERYVWQTKTFISRYLS